MKTIDSTIKRPLTTGIGSLPHSYVDSALNYSFRHSISFLPQIPIRNPKEFMIFQSLDGLPGLHEGNNGEPLLDLNQWANKTHSLKNQLEQFFLDSSQTLTTFEPSPEVYSSWRPFIFECEERKVKFAKIQIAGPLTSQWVLKVFDGKKQIKTEEVSDLANQIFQLVLAKALSMSRMLKQRGITPLFFFDEPGLYVFDHTNPFHGLSLKELSLCIQTLKKEGTIVGLHCCSQPEWKSLFSLQLDIISFDINLALESLLKHGSELEKFIQSNSIFSFGILPTTSNENHLMNKEYAHKKYLEIKNGFQGALDGKQIDIYLFLRNCLYTAACGLTYQSIKDSEETLDTLQSLSAILNE